MIQAYRFFKRLKGLMFTNELATGCALHIKPCRSIHTFFMKYEIDVLYLDKKDVVVGIDERMSPGKVGQVYSRVASVIELPAGLLQETNTKVGDTVQFKN